MPSNENNQKVNKLFDEFLNDLSSSENAEAYLKSEGLDPDKLVSDGLRKIKQLKMQMASAKTETSYSALTSAVMAKAKEEARKLMDLANFDLASFIKKEGITVSYRNLESLSKEEVRELLEKHLLLKLQQGDDDKK
jgi:hypothetical protein